MSITPSPRSFVRCEVAHRRRLPGRLCPAMSFGLRRVAIVLPIAYTGAWLGYYGTSLPLSLYYRSDWCDSIHRYPAPIAYPSTTSRFQRDHLETSRRRYRLHQTSYGLGEGCNQEEVGFGARRSLQGELTAITDSPVSSLQADIGIPMSNGESRAHGMLIPCPEI